MKKILIALSSLIATTVFGQERGNAIYEANAIYGNYNNYQQYSYPKNANNYLLTDSTYMISAKVMMNILPDAYIAVFAVQEEALTVTECNKQIKTRIDNFKSALKRLGVKEDDMFVDLVAQTKIYDYKLTEKTASEYQQGFELKKNVIVKFTKHEWLEEMMLLASEYEIYDIVKVDYIINDQEKYFDEMRNEAVKVIEKKKKLAQENSSLVINDRGVLNAESTNIVYPSEGYRQYTAAETSTVRSNYYNTDKWVKDQRKSKTFYFEKLNAANFDRVLNGGMVKIPIQLTLDVSVKYYLETKEKKK